jgi:hypothetical protein
MPVNKPPREPPTTIDLDMLAERNGIRRNGRRGYDRAIRCLRDDLGSAPQRHCGAGGVQERDPEIDARADDVHM